MRINTRVQNFLAALLLVLVPALSWGITLSDEPTVVVTASSENASTGQTAAKTIDGVVDGYPGDFSREWATSGEGAGAWVQLDWPVAYSINQVNLYDRPNSTDHVRGGTLRFSDGSTVSVGTLPNDGSQQTINFTPRISTSVRFTVNDERGSNIGLAEMEVFGEPAGNVAPVSDAGSDQIVNENQNVTLDGSASDDPNDDPITYLWSQSGGVLVSLSDTTAASPTFTSPSGIASTEILIFDLAVFDGEFTTTDSVTITVTSSQAPINLARDPSASVSASTENLPIQPAASAIDGIIDGFPGDFLREWASDGERDGAWIEISWPSTQLISQVVLYDRPNTVDRITEGLLTFSDGSTVAVGALDNAGAATTVNFTPRATTSVRLTVTRTSSRTGNVGLAEIEIFGIAAGNVATER